MNKQQSRVNIGLAPLAISITKDHSSKLSELSDEFTTEEIVLLNKIYGIMYKIINDLMGHKYGTDLNREVELSLRMLLIELLKDNYSEVMSMEFYLITRDFCLSKMQKKYKELLSKLIKISGVQDINIL